MHGHLTYRRLRVNDKRRKRCDAGCAARDAPRRRSVQLGPRAADCAPFGNGTQHLGATVSAGMSCRGRYWLARVRPLAVCAGLAVVGCGGDDPPKPDREAVEDVVMAFFEDAARKDV